MNSNTAAQVGLLEKFLFRGLVPTFRGILELISDIFLKGMFFISFRFPFLALSSVMDGVRLGGGRIFLSFIHAHGVEEEMALKNPSPLFSFHCVWDCVSFEIDRLV